MDSWGDGWTIYVWLIAGAMIVLAAMYWIRWAAKHDQFDEDIKYVVFDKGDRDKMSAEEFKKAMEVNQEQEKLREEYLEKDRAERESKQH